MTYNVINELIVSAESSGHESFWKYCGEEMADVYACGIHDYANERYQKNYDYPEEWFDETERIDKWISNNEGYIYKWMYDLILGHKSEVLKLGKN